MVHIPGENAREALTSTWFTQAQGGAASKYPKHGQPQQARTCPPFFEHTFAEDKNTLSFNNRAWIQAVVIHACTPRPYLVRSRLGPVARRLLGRAGPFRSPTTTNLFLHHTLLWALALVSLAHGCCTLRGTAKAAIHQIWPRQGHALTNFTNRCANFRPQSRKMSSLGGRGTLSPRAARITSVVPCLTGNPHTAQQRKVRCRCFRQEHMPPRVVMRGRWCT